MKVWLFNTAEPLPEPGKNFRLLRTGLLAAELLRRGHEVEWWSSDFDHFSKSYRQRGHSVITVSQAYKVKLVPTQAYHKNVSLRRMISHAIFARNLYRAINQEQRPDIIISSMPNLDTAAVATRVGASRNVPVLLDLRDMWPDIFLHALPRWALPFGSAAVLPMRHKLAHACRAARGLIGITSGFLNWGLAYAGRDRSADDAFFPHAYPAAQPKDADINEAEAFWKSQGLPKDVFLVSFIGSIRPRNDLITVIKSAKLLGDKFFFVLGGSGEQMESLRAAASGLANVLLPGWLNHPQIHVLLRRSQAAIAPYRNSPDYVISIPNKPIEYISAGLPIVSCLSGELENLICSHNIGVMYEEGDAKGLAEAILSLANSRDKEAMRSNALNLYHKQFTAELVYSNYAAHVEEVLERYREEYSRKPCQFSSLRASGWQ